LADYTLDIPQDGLVQLDAWFGGSNMDVLVAVTGADSGPAYGEHKFLSGTGFSSDSRPFDNGFGGPLSVKAGQYYYGKVSNSVVFTLAAGRYRLTVTNWGWDEGYDYKFKVNFWPSRWPADSESNDTPALALPAAFGGWQSGRLAYNTENESARDKVDYYTFSLQSDVDLQVEYGDDDYLGARFAVCDQSGNAMRGDVYDSGGNILSQGAESFATLIAGQPPYMYVPPEGCTDNVRTAKLTLKTGRYYVKVEETRNLGGAYRFRLGMAQQQPAAPPPVQQQPVTQYPAQQQPAQQVRTETPAYTGSGGISIMVNKSLIRPDVPPQIINGRTMVPVRFVAQALDCRVDWDEATQTVVITSPGHYKAVPPPNGTGQILILVDGNLINPDVPPQLINNRTMVPVRFIAEAMGTRVDWDEATQTVSIDSGAGTAPESGTVVHPPLVGPYIDQSTQVLLERRTDAGGREIFVPTDRSQVPVKAGVPVINASVLLENALHGQNIKAVLEYNHGEASLTTEDLIMPKSGSGYIGFSFTQSTAEWPTGDYEIKIFLDGVYKASTPFDVVEEDGTNVYGG